MPTRKKIDLEQVNKDLIEVENTLTEKKIDKYRATVPKLELLS